jgi:hypothetical protein
MRKALLVPVSLAILVIACSQWPASDSSALGPTVVSAPSHGIDPTLTGVVADASVAAPQKLRLAETVRFGLANVGSPFPPPSGHDESGHAGDTLVPRTAVIDPGGIVTFNVPANVHQIAIYAPGKEVKDVNAGALVPIGQAGCPPGNLLINDTAMRIGLFQNPCFTPWTAEFKFDSPGRYLVICAFVFHFQIGMYGWVEVRDAVGGASAGLLKKGY